MQSPHLTSVRSKISRAQTHLDAIKASLRLVLGTAPQAHPVSTQIDPNTQEIVIGIPKAETVDPGVSLLIGDCVHNLRSALDHLVYQLAVRNGTSDKAATKTFFPICLTSSEFDDRPKKLVKPYIAIDVFAEIQRSQPYAAYDVPEESDIWMLHKLDIIDKHRLLLVAREKFAATEFTVTVPDMPPLRRRIPQPNWKPMEDGAEVLRLQLVAVAGRRPSKMSVKAKLGRTVEFIDTGLACDGMLVVPALEQITALVSAIVRDFGQQFFDE